MGKAGMGPNQEGGGTLARFHLEVSTLATGKRRQKYLKR